MYNNNERLKKSLAEKLSKPKIIKKFDILTCRLDGEIVCGI